MRKFTGTNSIFDQGRSDKKLSKSFVGKSYDSQLLKARNFQSMNEREEIKDLIDMKYSIYDLIASVPFEVLKE
jgi:hypothetical protein